MIEILDPFLDKKYSNKIVYPVIVDNTRYEFYIQYACPKIKLNMNIDAIVIMFSSIAICNKWKITSKLPIDKVLYDNLLNLPNTYKKYHKKHTSLLGMVSIDELNLILDMPTCDRTNDDNKGLNVNITPITMGIDSLHTILTNRNELSHIIYVNDMDLSNKCPKFYNKIYFVSKRYNKQLIVANSNFKKTMSSLKVHGTNYGVFTGDSILLASCYPLGLKKLYLSGFGCKNFPCLSGQHSDINKYFNSNEFTTCNNETERIKKIDFIVKTDEEIIKHMRVCNEWTDAKCDNCSKCNKCVRTMLYFYMLGYYDKITNTFLILDETIMKDKLITLHKVSNPGLASVYYNKIYEEFLNLYMQNNMQPLNCIINDYVGDFVNEDYHLSPSPST